MSDTQNKVYCSTCRNKRCIFVGSDVEKEVCYDYKPLRMSGKRNKIDCRMCHNMNCTLAGQEYNMATCTAYKTLTNYDELHAMNVEQLAEWIDKNMCNAMWCDDTAPVDPDTKICKLHDCKQCIVKWLESEAKDG